MTLALKMWEIEGMRKECGNCIYWDPELVDEDLKPIKRDKAHYGDCRRNPPQVISLHDYEGDTGHQAVWPTTSKTDFCHRWSK